MTKVYIYSDGGCKGNPGVGGWGTILVYNEHVKELSGSVAHTTNNRMELTAAIEGLKQLKSTCRVQLVTDSKYVCDGAMKWLAGWKQKQWKGANKQAIKNQDLWMCLDDLLQQHDVTLQWVKGHAGHPYNERADTLATQAMDNFVNLMKP